MYVHGDRTHYRNHQQMTRQSVTWLISLIVSDSLMYNTTAKLLFPATDLKLLNKDK